jgi:Pentapeptide repeats (9 copies)
VCSRVSDTLLDRVSGSAARLCTLGSSRRVTGEAGWHIAPATPPDPVYVLGGAQRPDATRDGRHIPRAASRGWVDFEEAAFSGTVYFGEATFSDGTVYFGDAWFSDGTVTFGGAGFSGGRVDFYGAAFSGGTVDFTGAGFFGGEVSFRAPRDWSHPPVFDWMDTPPACVVLP